MNSLIVSNVSISVDIMMFNNVELNSFMYDVLIIEINVNGMIRLDVVYLVTITTNNCWY
jgi:hypothetical protein